MLSTQIIFAAIHSKLVEFNANFFLQIFNTFVLFSFLTWKLFKPVSKVLEDRKNKIKNQFDSAEEKVQEANALYESYKEKLDGIKSERDEIIKEAVELHHEGNLGHENTSRYNVYATFAGVSSKSILFNGHIDTMPPGELSHWRTKPHDPIIANGRLYGLGSADMKAGLLSGILAVKLFKDAGIPLPVTVKIASVADEEGGGNGSVVATMNGQKADGVIVCEPTNGELVLANMAFVFFKVTVLGSSCHSGAKWLGVNAIEKAIFLMSAIEELEHRWLLTKKHPLLPPPSQNFGVIEGGSAGSTVPDHCCFKTCVHYLPNQMNYEEVVREYTECINTRANGDSWLRENPPQIEIYQTGGGFEIDREERLPSAMSAAWKHTTGNVMPVVGSPSGCDCRLWANIANCPVIQTGPGELKDCHTPNESVSVSQFYQYIEAFAELILSW